MEPLGQRSCRFAAGQATVMIQQPDPLELVAGFAQPAGSPGDRLPDRIEILSQRTVRVDEAFRREPDDATGGVEPTLIAGRLRQGVESFEEVHMRVLAPRQRPQIVLRIAAMRGGELALDPVHRRLRQADGRGLAGRPVIVGASEEHEGEIVEVAARHARAPVRSKALRNIAVRSLRFQQ